jgi:hypothetical protein
MSDDNSACPKIVHECEHAKIVIDQSSDEIVVRIKINNEASGDAPHSNVTPITARRGTRIPPDFTVTDEMKQWAREQTPDVDGWYELQKFKDYWQSLTGRTSTKLDWVGTWRNWMRKAQEDESRHRSRLTGQRPGTAAAQVAYTPPAPPREVADDPVAYQAWCARHRAEHKQQGASSW